MVFCFAAIIQKSNHLFRFFDTRNFFFEEDEYLQGIKPYAVQMAMVLHQVFCREGLPMSWINHCGVECNRLLPRLLVLLQILNPDDDALDAGEIVHSGIATEQDAILQH